MMTCYFLTRLQIEGFRGICNQGRPLDLRFRANAVNSIWAPNGFGKSSVFEALCYVIKGDIPKLSRLEASERPADYYHNRFHDGDGTITVTFSPDGETSGGDVVISVACSHDGERRVTSPSGHPDPERFLQSLNEDHVLVDYVTFSTFMDDSALERGRSFSALLGMAYLSEVRQALEQLSNQATLRRDLSLESIEAQLRRLDNQKSTAEARLRASYQTFTKKVLPERFDVNAVIEESTAILAAHPVLSKSMLGCTLMDVSFEALAEEVKRAERSEDQARLAVVLQSLAALEALAPDEQESAELEHLSRLIKWRDEALRETRGELFQRMYEAVQAVLESGKWETPDRCPACESVPAIDPKEFISQRLSAFSLAKSMNEELATSWARASCRRRLHDLESSGKLVVPEHERCFDTLDHSFRCHAASKDAMGALRSCLESLEKLRRTTLEGLRAERARLESDLPESLVALTEQIDAARQLKRSLQELQELDDPRGDRAQLTKQLQRRTEWSEFICTAAAEFAEAEAEFSRSQAAALQDSYREMYSIITSQTSIVPALRKPYETERLIPLLDEFYGLSSVPARPLLSESYRNAFGISVFLSAAMVRRGNPRFIVLDDITSSFDAGHQIHLMELIRTKVALPENPNGLQVILLSHDALLEKYFSRLSGSAAWHHVRLVGSPPKGAVYTESVNVNYLRTDIERLLDAGRVHQAEPLIRQYLECRLLQILRKVSIPVPIDFAVRDDRRMVQDCLDCITTAVELHRLAGILVMDPSQVSDLTSAHVPALVANWVSHYETGSTVSLGPTALRGILDTIDKFVDCFRYDDPDSGRRCFYRSLRSDN